MNDKKRKFMVRLVCLILAGLMIIGAGAVLFSTILG